MSKLESLRITECPYAFASFAEKHNALVDMLAGMVGQNGITVVMAEKNAVIRANIAGGSGGGGGGITMDNVYASLNANVANVVGNDGRLQNVYKAAAIANAWPTVGKWVTASGNVDIGASSVVLTTAGGKTCNIAWGSITQNISIQNIQVCDGGNIKHMLVVGSAAF